MNFKEYFILENKNFKQVFFHGTCLKFLPSILSQGLIPNSNKKTNWNKNRELNVTSRDATSYGGIYLTDHVRIARSAAIKSAQDNNSSPIIVICAVNLKTAISDEDYVAVPDIFNKNIYQNLYLYKSYLNPEDVDLKNFYNKSYEDWKKKFFNLNISSNGLNSDFLKRMDQLLKNLFLSLIRLTIVFSLDDHVKFDWSKLFNYQDVPELPNNKKNAEDEYRKYHDLICKHVKRFEWAIRIMTPIKFSGSNRIISIIEIIDKDNLKLHYGSTVPDHFIDEYKNFVSNDVVISKV